MTLQISHKYEGHSIAFHWTCAHFGIIWHLGLKNLKDFPMSFLNTIIINKTLFTNIYIYIFLKLYYILGAWAHLIKKDILFAYTPQKDAFLSVFNENIFFSKFSGLDGCNTRTRKRYRIIPDMSLLLIKIGILHKIFILPSL